MRDMGFEVKHIKAGGFNTRYLEAGDRSKSTLMLIHDGAFGTTAELCWSGVLAEFARDYHVLAPELLGWGGTDKVVYFDRSPYAARIPHISAFVHELGVEEAEYLGSSFGGSLILRASVASDNPWRMRRAISIAGSGGPYRMPVGLKALSDYKPSMQAAAELIELIGGPTTGLEEHIRQRYANSLIPGHWESLMAPYLKNPSIEQTAPADDYLDRLAKTEVPSLLIEGRHDPMLETGWSEKLAALSPNISAITIDSGHGPNMECPAKVVELTRTFLSSAGDAR
jgi:pimeloyl-ACP methyl ester carboxylesterase